MNAEIVHIVAQSLPPEELQRLYFLIQEQISEAKIVVKKSKEPLITKHKSMENVLKSLTETKKTRFSKLAYRQTRTSDCSIFYVPKKKTNEQ
jgi:hypothetical protein